MKKEQELVVITKTYDLILWSCNHTSKFPRNHRFVLGERIERNLYDLLETLIRAKYTKNRQRLLDQDSNAPPGICINVGTLSSFHQAGTSIGDTGFGVDYRIVGLASGSSVQPRPNAEALP
jgi:hypothetical protein